MKIVFICNSYADNIVDTLRSNSRIPLNNAVNNFQRAVIKGLVDNDADFMVECFPSLGCYPRNFSKTSVEEASYVFDGKNVGRTNSYITLPFLKDWSIRRSIYRKVKKALSANNGAALYVLTYNPTVNFIKPLARLKRTHKNLVICSIVTDLVDDAFNYKSNTSFAKRIQFYFESKNLKALYPYIDKYLLLSEHMVEKIPCAQDRYTILEGIANVDQINSVERGPVEDDIKSLLYTGTLEQFAGINNLIDAFMRTANPDFRLIICGNGSSLQYVQDACSKDSRIIYKGMVQYSDVLKMQKQATALINPRQPNGGITKYSFPSKTMEYLASGTPMIGYKLEGIPDEYFKYMYTVEDDSIESLSNCIKSVLCSNSDDLRVFGNKARTFINESKTSKYQVRKIIDFLQN